MENLQKIRDLRMYIPFIDFAASLDKEKYSKLLRIKEWILENKMFAVEVLEKFKQSILVQYKNLLIEDVKIPKCIMHLFNNNANTRVETIDLCSDDEQTERNNVTAKPSCSAKLVEKKSIQILKTNDLSDLSDGEIVDSDTETKVSVVKKPINFQISAERIKPYVKEKVDHKNSTKNSDSAKIDSKKKDSTKKSETLKYPNVTNIRKEIEKVLSKEKCPSIMDKEVPIEDKEDEETEALLKQIEKICDESDNKNNDSIECMSISDNSIDEIAFELINNRQQPADEATKKEIKDEQIKSEEQIFTRRSYKIENSPILFDDFDLKKKNKRRKKKRLSHTEKTLLSDVSSDEDLVPIDVAKPIPKKRVQKTETVTFAISDTDELIEKGVNADISNCKTEKSLLSNTCSEKELETMDINELTSCFKKLVEDNNVNLEQFLVEIDNNLNSSPTTSPYYAAEKDNELISSPTTIPYYAADLNMNMNAYATNEYKYVEAFGPTPLCSPHINVYSTSYAQPLPPQFPQMPQFPIMQRVPQQPPPVPPPPAEANRFPIININGTKINLNDPRLMQQLLNFQKTSDQGSAKQKPPNGQFVGQSNERPPNGYRSGPSQPQKNTYGAYKRRQAEKEEYEQAEKRKQAEIRKQAYLEKLNKHKSIEVTNSNSVLPAVVRNSNNIKEGTQTQKTVEVIRYNDPKRTHVEETEKADTTKQLDKRPHSNKNRKSPLLETVETDISSTNNCNATKTPPKKNTKLSSTLRILKELECTFKGFDKLEDYLPLSSSGKRKSSETARSAISKQLNVQQLYNENTTPPEVLNNKRKGIPTRRSSMGHHALDETNISQNSPAPIAKRRKTCTEVSLATLLQDSSTDSADEIMPGRQYFTAPKKALQIESSSSDTDTFDFDDFNYKKSKAIALKNQPYVLLQRLTEEEINKHIRRPVPPEKMCLNVKLIEKKTREAPEYCKPSAAAASKTKNLPNIDVRMTERNTSICALCKSKPVNLVNHYIRSHKTEPYVSRLTSKELEDLQLNCPFAVLAGPSNARVPRYKVQCLFCADELIDSFINFYTHYSTHTGEYAFQCYNCELKKPYRADIQSHKNHSKSCRNASIQKLYVYPTNLMVIYLHCCKLCNFVQLNEANVFKHLREQHAKRGDDAIYVQKYIAAAINDAEIVNELLPEEETEFLAREASFENHQESDSELNCSEIDIKPDLSPYSSVLDDNNMQNTTTIHMTTIPISNLKTTCTSSFLDKKLATSKDETVVEQLPRPIIVKSEVKIENDSGNFEMPPNCYTAHLDYRTYPHNMPSFGVYKCMSTDCFFSTDAEAEMAQHLYDHGSSECPPTNWLECSYCQLQHEACSTAEDLIAHIKLKHCQSRFQCSFCCYRSCVPGSVAIHSAVVHNTELDTIFMYECEGESQSPKERIPDMMKSAAAHVKKLQCRHCSLGFYAISALKEHLNRAHGSLADDPVLLLEYSCIYCVKDLPQKKDMAEHIALKHPDELVFACRRILKNPLVTGDVIENLLLQNITEIVSLTAIRKPITPATLVQSTCSSSPLEQTENATNLLPEECIPNQELNTTDSGTESAAPELLDEQRDLKPSPEQLVYIAEETLRALLNKLTAKTGLSPDRLYHCPVATCGGFFSTHALWSRHMSLRHNCLITRCPHCPKQLELALSDFKQHFEQHCRHLYVCFHCSETFASEQDTILHFQAIHSNEPRFRFELIKFNLMHSYHIILSESASAERLEFCQILHDNVAKRLEQLANEESSKLLSKWLVPASAEWLEDYPSSNRSSIKTCIVKICQYKTRNMEEMFQHFETSHSITGDFKCSRCSLHLTNLNSWRPIVDHVRMHDSSYVCSVCNYHHFGRQQMSTHIMLEHNSRDVPFVSLFHSSEHTYIGAGVIFAASYKTFSTTNTCFFCNAKNLSVETLSKHFKQVHNVSMHHFCEICSAQFKNLTEVDAHHSSLHAGSQMKIRCEFVSHLQLIVRSTFPLSIDIMSADSVLTAKSKQSSAAQLSGCTAKSGTIDQHKAPCVDGSAESSSTQIRIKEEIPDDDGNASDSDVEIIEDDDLVRAEEFKARRNEQKEKEKAQPRLRVKNMFENNTTPTTPVTVTPITAANVPMSISITPVTVQPNLTLKQPTITLKQPTELKQTATQVTIKGTQNNTVNHPLLQQALNNNAARSMQQPAPQIQPKSFSSMSNQSSSQQLIGTPNGSHIHSFMQKAANNNATVSMQQPAQQIQPKSFSSMSNLSSSQQKFTGTLNGPGNHSFMQEAPCNDATASMQQPAQQIQPNTLHNNVSTYQTAPQTFNFQKPVDNHQKQHLSSVLRQIRPKGQQQNEVKKIIQTTYSQQPIVTNQQQHLSTVPQQIRPTGQGQQLKPINNNSSKVQATPQTISVRLSAPVTTNQSMRSPTMQHLSPLTPKISIRHLQPSTEEFVKVMQTWVPQPSLDVTYIAPTNNNNNYQINYTAPQTYTPSQSFNSSPHNYFH